MRIGDWIQTYTGRAYYPADPRAEDVSIIDIAHALSQMCRFGGHTNRFYSVAEHSVHVSTQVPPDDALVALLHDATEAYVVDVPRPLKRMLSNYAEFEEKSWLAICEKFQLDPDMPTSVKLADNTVLLAERDELMLPPEAGSWAWASGLVAAPVRILALAPEKAKQLFLRRFAELQALRQVAVHYD